MLSATVAMLQKKKSPHIDGNVTNISPNKILERLLTVNIFGHICTVQDNSVTFAFVLGNTGEFSKTLQIGEMLVTLGCHLHHRYIIALLTI